MKELDILFSSVISADVKMIFFCFTEKNQERGMWGFLVKTAQGNWFERWLRPHA